MSEGEFRGRPSPCPVPPSSRRAGTTDGLARPRHGVQSFFPEYRRVCFTGTGHLFCSSLFYGRRGGRGWPGFRLRPADYAGTSRTTPWQEATAEPSLQTPDKPGLAPESVALDLSPQQFPDSISVDAFTGTTHLSRLAVDSLTLVLFPIYVSHFRHIRVFGRHFR